MQKCLLVILDGWGIAPDSIDNAISIAACPNYRNLITSCPHTELACSGRSVGLPEGQMGNSEVGHLNIGAGRRVLQDYTRITEEIENGDFYKNDILVDAMHKALERGSSLHVMGLLSDGGVHSHIEHLYALLKMAQKEHVEDIRIHAFLDGRDVPPKSALFFFKELENYLESGLPGRIDTVMGRYYAMDRDNRWDRIETAYMAMAKGVGKQAANAFEAVEDAYNNGQTDEFIVPYVLQGAKTIEPEDVIIFFNFRPDRARQITRCFVDKDFDYFQIEKKYTNTFFVGFTQYDATLNSKTVFPPIQLNHCLAEEVSNAGMLQYHLAETEKYAHVTFFFNGGVEDKFPGEERLLIPSPKVATYDMLPEMSAYKVCNAVIDVVQEEKYEFVVVNFANPDMVGHTGKLDAAVAAVNTVDVCLGKIIETACRHGYCFMVTADHGNVEKMYDEITGQPLSAHTTNPVPFIIGNYCDLDITLRSNGILADIAPTILQVMEINKPQEMTGKSLILL